MYRNKVFFHNCHSFNNIYTKNLCYLKLFIHQYPQQFNVIVTDILSALQSLCTHTHLTIQLLSRSWTGCPRRGILVVSCWVPALGLPDNKSTIAVANIAAIHGELSDKAWGRDVDAHLHEILLSAWWDEWLQKQGKILWTITWSV